MQLRYPKSFIKLVLIGFTLVGLPLALALFTSALSIDRLAKYSESAVHHAAQYARGTRLLAESLASMERGVRQYVILGDAEFLDAYRTAHAEFGQTLQQLAKQKPYPDLAARLRDLGAREKALNLQITENLESVDRLTEILDRFVELDDAVSVVLGESDALIEHEVESMRDMAAHSRDIVLKRLWMLFPMALAVVVGFAMMLARPIRQIEAVIRQLGSGDWRTEIEVDGPEDMRMLGERLDWLRRQLREVEEQKMRFLQQVSHDLKTPLSALREGADLLADGSLGQLSATQQEVALILQQNAIKLHRLIEELLQYSALQTQARQVKHELVPLKPIARKAVAAQQMQSLNKALDIELECPRLIVETDADKLRVILDNLLSNAIKYSPHKGKVRLALARREDTLTIDVTDDGPGVPPADRMRIFERFFHRGGPEQGPVASTGLGLAIVAEFVHALDGTVAVLESARGAHFCVRLPCRYWTDET